ncbi:MAG TPA: LysR substrate-binding domain-containing protein [Ideonella sp.]|nr:LysR substrate-binding domain-containing protein [Ideonella sp.]
METRRLEYFIRIVEYRSITKAAAQIGIAQPALSQQLAILEHEFKAKLLHRTAQGVEPTPAGADLYRHARILLRQLEQAHHVVKSATAAPSGPLSVGLPVSTAQLLSVPFLETVCAQYPQIQLQLTEGLSGHLTELVLNARLDVALLFQAGPIAGLSVEPLWHEDLLLIGPGDARLPDPLSLEQLADLPLVLPARGNGARTVFDAVMAQHNLPSRVVAEVDSIPTLKRAVQQRLGYTFLPWAAVMHEVETGSLSAINVDAPKLFRTVSLCSPSSMPQTRPMEVAMRLLRELSENMLASPALKGVRRAT